MPEPVCVRCRGPLSSPETAGQWTCDAHGVVEPLHPARPAEAHHLADAASSSGVPVWNTGMPAIFIPDPSGVWTSAANTVRSSEADATASR